MISSSEKSKLKAQIELARFIETIASSAKGQNDTDIKGIRDNRRKEAMKKHIDYIEEYAVGGNGDE